MSPEEAYEAWAPPSSEWSRWAKPVLFALLELPPAPPPTGVRQGGEVSLPEPGRLGEAPWAPAPAEGAAIVVDLPGAESALLGLALARKGYRPVPLYNGVYHEAAVVPVGELVGTLLELAREVQELRLPEGAPPAFLLDSRRLEGASDIAPGKFDNRWVVLPQDFPSANLLLSRNLRLALLVQREPGRPRDDLAHVLLRWQQAGINIEWLNPHAPGEPKPITVQRPWGFKWVWYRILAMLGLRRNSAGGFGALVPEASSGG